MPWKETNAMKEKRLFIDAMLKQDKSFRELCREYGISEKTGYKWRKRFYEQGYAGLAEESRAPRAHPNTIDGDTAAELIRLRLAHPSWGGKKLLVLYHRAHPNLTPPSLSSVNRIIEKAGLLKKKRVHRAAITSDCPRLNQSLEVHAPNDVWCIDFKGWWRSDGEICEPFTVRDKYSRKATGEARSRPICWRKSREGRIQKPVKMYRVNRVTQGGKTRPNNRHREEGKCRSFNRLYGGANSGLYKYIKRDEQNARQRRCPTGRKRSRASREATEKDMTTGHADREEKGGRIRRRDGELF